MRQDPMHETLGYAFSEVCKLRRAHGSALLEKTGLHRGQHFILSTLWEQEGLTHSELADRVLVRPATITNALKRMEAAGFIERRRDSEDQRVSRVYLTDAGRDVRASVQAVWQELEERSFGSLSQEDQLLLRRLLRKIYESLAQAGAPRRHP